MDQSKNNKQNKQAMKKEILQQMKQNKKTQIQQNKKTQIQQKKKQNLQKLSNEDFKFFVETFQKYSGVFDVDAISTFFWAIVDLYLSANISSRDAIFNVKDKQELTQESFKKKLIAMTETMLSFIDKKELEELPNYKFIFQSYLENYRNFQMQMKKRQQAKKQTQQQMS